ncbi:cytochrome b5-like [Anneissia japonica]|uniref:cytochrome b5-like n=1 Tax=Anneissia japonica TaxID=1529436 RepID=UPI0014257FB0|nr:cytochrome b5-like [Anneissia japonica]
MAQVLTERNDNRASVALYTLSDVANHSDANSCWIVIDNYVVDVTQFLTEHPGGKEIILEHAGRDATGPFKTKGHSPEATKLLSKYIIGQLVLEERIYIP